MHKCMRIQTVWTKPERWTSIISARAHVLADGMRLPDPQITHTHTHTHDTKHTHTSTVKKSKQVSQNSHIHPWIYIHHKVHGGKQQDEPQETHSRAHMHIPPHPYGGQQLSIYKQSQTHTHTHKSHTHNRRGSTATRAVAFLTITSRSSSHVPTTWSVCGVWSTARKITLKCGSFQRGDSLCAKSCAGSKCPYTITSIPCLLQWQSGASSLDCSAWERRPRDVCSLREEPCWLRLFTCVSFIRVCSMLCLLVCVSGIVIVNVHAHTHGIQHL